MKIACLQLAPQVGDIDNNLNRADAVLSRANVEDLLGLDLLVLPELAFSGTYPPYHVQTKSLTSQATTSTPSGPSRPSSSPRALASARCGPAPRPCATTASSSSATPKRST